MTLRLARSRNRGPLLGDDEGFVPLSAVDPALRTVCDALPSAADSLPSPASAPVRRVPPEELAFAAPFDPGKLLGIGLNYVEHAEDLDESTPDAPASFLKPASAVTGPGGPIRLPFAEMTDRVTAEAELAVVIGRTCSDVDPADVDGVIAGVLPVIDVTAEDVLAQNPRFLTRAKSFDTFLVFGPGLQVCGVNGLEDASVRTVLNGETIAENRVRNMMFSPRDLVSFHSQVMTLEPGDVISTGTPGAAVIDEDDRVRAEVDGIGTVDASVV